MLSLPSLRSRAPHLSPGPVPGLVLCLCLVTVLAGGLACTPTEEGADGEAGQEAVADREAGDEAAVPEDLATWRQEREAGLREEDGWLTLVGLHWLGPGEQTFGSGEGNAIVFPAKAPERIGTLRLEGETLTVTADPQAGLTHGGDPVTEMELALDTSGEPTVLEVGSFSFHAIHREDKIGIRLRDRESPLLAEFEGIESFPYRPDWRLEATLIPHEEPVEIGIPNVLGQIVPSPSPGTLELRVAGEIYRLEPIAAAATDPLFVVFGDATNGDETYGGGRFLATEAPDEDGRVILDFNRAYNPPCVFTPYATCPLPPQENKLAVAIPAGEKMWHGGVGH